MKLIESFDEFFDHCEKNNIGTVDADVFVKALRRKEFEKLIASSPSYLKLVFQHGERLFIFEDCQYKIAAVQLAWELEQHNQSQVDELQKRLDAAQKVADKMVKGTVSVSMFAYELEQALNGGAAK